MADLLFSFQGRANRAKFWLVALGIVVVEMIIFAAILGGAATSGDPEQIQAALMAPIPLVVVVVFFVIALWVSLAVAVKRFHDRNKSGWWILIVFVPFFGHLWYLIECGFLRGTSGPNNYGPDPLAAI